MRIVFFGSDQFAAEHLEAILDSKHEVAACVTSPDKPQGRGMKMTLPVIKTISASRRIPCLQPVSLKSAQCVQELRSFSGDIFVVVSYGRLLTQEALDIPKIFSVNVHGSLLPKYRGAAPINRAILDGETETGITVLKMALELDAGDIIAQEKMAIGRNETSEQLRVRMAQQGAQLLIKVLDAIEANTHTLTPQNQGLSSYAHKLTREMGRVAWDDPAPKIYNQLRGLQPWPGLFTFYNGHLLKITSASLIYSQNDAGSSKPGQIIAIDKNGFTVATGNGGLLITGVHPQAGNPMSAVSFMAGHKLNLGNLLG
jgi:methionyl-tRNA formyltransferase